MENIEDKISDFEKRKRIEQKLRMDLLKKKNIVRRSNPIDINKFKFRDTSSDKEKKNKDIESNLRTSFKEFVDK